MLRILSFKKRKKEKEEGRKGRREGGRKGGMKEKGRAFKNRSLLAQCCMSAITAPNGEGMQEVVSSELAQAIWQDPAHTQMK